MVANTDLCPLCEHALLVYSPHQQHALLILSAAAD
jgi:hypothetical protein